MPRTLRYLRLQLRDDAVVVVADVFIDAEVVQADAVCPVGVGVGGEDPVQVVLVVDRLAEHQILEQAVVGVQLAHRL
jgi:hypothetical protein